MNLDERLYDQAFSNGKKSESVRIADLEAKVAEQAKDIEGLERFRRLRMRHNEEMERKQIHICQLSEKVSELETKGARWDALFGEGQEEKWEYTGSGWYAHKSGCPVQLTPEALAAALREEDQG